MRHAHTISDVAKLLQDYEVLVLLTDKATVEFVFPRSEKEIQETKCNQNRVNAIYGNYQNSIPYVQFSRKTRYVVRSLVGNPRFWRLTTTADQICNFTLVQNKSDAGLKRYGIMKVRKKRDENLHLVFIEQRFAKRFFTDIEWLYRFERVKEFFQRVCFPEGKKREVVVV